MTRRFAAETARRGRVVSRGRVVVGTAIAVLVVVGVATLADALRHPIPPDASDEVDVAARRDPRIGTECAEPAPREGQERAGVGTLRAREVSAAVLIDCPETYAGATVRYTGEVVGGILRRTDGAWVHLNDDAYALAAGPLPWHRDYRGPNTGVGVFVPREVADDVRFVGGPDTRGDVLTVEGVFRRVDPVSGEVVVIRADRVQIVRRGGPVPDAVLANRRLAALVVAAVAIAMLGSQVAVVRRERSLGVPWGALREG